MKLTAALTVIRRLLRLAFWAGVLVLFWVGRMDLCLGLLALGQFAAFIREILRLR